MSRNRDLCGYCGQPDHQWVSHRGRRVRVEYRAASDAVGFLCSQCTQKFLRESVEMRLALWRDLHDVGDPRIRWVEQFLPEEEVRRARRDPEDTGFLRRGDAARSPEDETGDPLDRKSVV